mgnify:CR=1 FL=1
MVVVEASSVVAEETSSTEVVPSTVVDDVNISIEDSELTVSVAKVEDSVDETPEVIVGTVAADDSKAEVVAD